MLKPPRVSIRAKVLSLLARRDYSSHELRQRLSQAGYAEDEVETVLTEMTASGCQSDQRFAEALLRRRAERGLYGSRRIRAELAQHGIDETVLDVLQQAHDEPEQEIERAKQWLRKRWQAERISRAGSLAQVTMLKALIARGFEYDAAKAAAAALTRELVEHSADF